MSDEFELAYRRVPESPTDELLARQVVDELERWAAEGLVVRFSTAIALAREAGVPLDYVLAERERRKRAAGEAATNGQQ